MQNIKLLYSIFCDDVRAEINGKVSLMGIFRAINAEAFPAAHERFFICNKWGRGRGKFKATIKIKTPDGDELVNIVGPEFELQDENIEHSDFVTVSNLKLPKAGIYPIELILNEELIETVYLNVIIKRAK